MNKTLKLTFAALALAAAFNAQAETHAVIKTNMGNISLSLDETKAPKTVANFVSYARKGFYDNTVFHRVIDGFMIQGGGFTADLAQKATDKAINNEADNGLKNTVGTIAMARTGDPNSATSQFFINTADNAFLDFKNKTPQGYGYAVFGKVT
ncbi:MAG: peptidylprolyl isomerase, partial [Neisseria sp.]|nr:peptidylprolyl isomerase [Neisseria sp.]